MYIIQANEKGSRKLNISEENLKTIKKYNLLDHLVPSNGIVDEETLERLRLNIRSMIASAEHNSKDLLDLCIDVIYHENMKALGLKNLVNLFNEWNNTTEEETNEEIKEISEE